MNPPLDNIAALLGRPADRLQLLDYRPLALAFVPGSYVTFVLRDRASGETMELTLDEATGQAVDAAALRQLDHSQAALRGKKLAPDLLSLVLCHADLAAIPVRVTLAPPAAQAGAEPGVAANAPVAAELREMAIDLPPQGHASQSPREMTLSAPQIVALAASPQVHAIALAGDPVIADQAG